MILFAVPAWKNIFSSAGRLRMKNELLPVMPKIWADKEANKHCVCDEISNTPNLFVHPSPQAARQHLPPLSQPAEGVPLNRLRWRHFNNSHLAQNGIIWVLSGFTSMTWRSIFRAAFFSDRLRRRQPDETLTPHTAFEVTSERCAALIWTPWVANALHSQIPGAALQEGGVFALREQISSQRAQTLTWANARLYTYVYYQKYRNVCETREK